MAGVMASAPACATCGTPLRWYAEHHGWGCDRCRQFHPVAARSRAPLYLVLGAVAVVGLVTAIVLASGGGKDDDGGSARRAKRTGGSTYGDVADNIEDALTQLEDFRDRECACKSSTCIDRVEREFKDWKRRVRDKLGDKAKSRDEERFDKIDRARKRCRDELSTGSDEIIDAYERYASQVCMCHDSPCTQRVTEQMGKEMADWSKRHMNDKPDPDMVKRLEPIMKRFTDCMTKAADSMKVDPSTIDP